MSTSVLEFGITGAAPFVTSDSASNNGDTAPGRQIAIVCTVIGNVKLRFTDGSTLTFPVAVGFLTLPWQVSQVFTTGTTFTGTVYNLR
jgi:hypothetical protein